MCLFIHNSGILNYMENFYSLYITELSIVIANDTISDGLIGVATYHTRRGGGAPFKNISNIAANTNCSLGGAVFVKN